MRAIANWIETMLWRLALACAVFLLFAPFTPRTMWLYPKYANPGAAATVRDSAGWDWLSPACGLLAFLALAIGWYWRQETPWVVFGAVIAALAFAATAYAAGQYWLALMRGAVDMPDYTTRPAPGPPYFTLVAMVGAGVALVLVGSWLRPDVRS